MGLEQKLLKARMGLVLKKLEKSHQYLDEVSDIILEDSFEGDKIISQYVQLSFVVYSVLMEKEFKNLEKIDYNIGHSEFDTFTKKIQEYANKWEKAYQKKDSKSEVRGLNVPAPEHSLYENMLGFHNFITEIKPKSGQPGIRIFIETEWSNLKKMNSYKIAIKKYG